MAKLAQEFSKVTTVGLDIAKHVFFAHAVDAAGNVAMSRSLGYGNTALTPSPDPPAPSTRAAIPLRR